MPTISVKELRSFLRAQTQEALIEIILEMFKRSKEVKDYFSLTLQPGYDQQMTEEYKDKVRKQFFPDRGFGDSSLSTVRKLISNYKRISDFGAWCVKVCKPNITVGCFGDVYGIK